MNKQFFILAFIFIALLGFGATQEACAIDADCPYLYQCNTGICGHKPLFPLVKIEYIGVLVTIIIAGLSSSGGVGGGTVLSPILLIFFRYTESISIMIVYAMIFGGAVGNFINAGLKRNPVSKKPYLNYDIVLTSMPPMLLGTSAGIILNRTIPPAVTVIGIIVLTSYTFTKISSKARTQFKKENKEKLDKPLLKDTTTEDSIIAAASDYSDETGLDTQLEAIIKEETQLLPFKKVAKILGLLFFMIALAILRGTMSFPSPIGVPYCGEQYWLLFVVGFVVCAACSVWNIKSIRAAQRVKKALNYVEKDEFVITGKATTKLSILSLIAGVLAGMFGIGGGTVMSPTLLSLGLNTFTLTPTSGAFVLQTSFMSLVSAALFGEVSYSTFGFFFAISFIGSFGVSYILGMLVKKYNRPSIILFTLIFVFGLSLIATPTFEVINHKSNMAWMITFEPIC